MSIRAWYFLVRAFGPRRSHSVSRRERTLEFVAVLLLSISTLAIAWSGYQAARWSGHQSRDYAAASTARPFMPARSTF